MARKKKRRKSQEEGVSMASLANDGMKDIMKFAKSNKEEDKLIGFNALLVFLTLSLGIASYFTDDAKDLFSILIFLGIGGVCAGILSIGYVKIFEMVANVVSNDVFAIKTSISALFFAISFSLMGLLFNLKVLVNVSFGIVVFQVILALILGFVKLPVESKIVGKKDNKIDLWTILGRIDIIAGLINFAAWIIGIIWRYGFT